MRQARVEALSWMRKDGKRGRVYAPPRMRKGQLLYDSAFEKRPRPIIRTCGIELGERTGLNGAALHEDDTFISANPRKARIRRRDHHSTFRLACNRLQSLAHREGIHLIKPRCRVRNEQREGTLRERAGYRGKALSSAGSELTAQSRWSPKRLSASSERSTRLISAAIAASS